MLTIKRCLTFLKLIFMHVCQLPQFPSNLDTKRKGKKASFLFGLHLLYQVLLSARIIRNMLIYSWILTYLPVQNLHIFTEFYHVTNTKAYLYEYHPMPWSSTPHILQREAPYLVYMSPADRQSNENHFYVSLSLTSFTSKLILLWDGLDKMTLGHPFRFKLLY